MTEPTESRGPEHAPCPPAVRRVIAEMEQIMREPRFNHAGVPSQVALDLVNGDQAGSFAEFELWLREMGSRVHFVAVPLDFYGPEMADRTVYPWPDRDDEPEYTLWVGVNGDEETAQLMESLGLSTEENLDRLPRTGFLTPPQ